MNLNVKFWRLYPHQQTYLQHKKFFYSTSVWRPNGNPECTGRWRCGGFECTKNECRNTCKILCSNIVPQVALLGEKQWIHARKSLQKPTFAAPAPVADPDRIVLFTFTHFLCRVAVNVVKFRAAGVLAGRAQIWSGCKSNNVSFCQH